MPALCGDWAKFSLPCPWYQPMDSGELVGSGAAKFGPLAKLNGGIGGSFGGAHGPAASTGGWPGGGWAGTLPKMLNDTAASEGGGLVVGTVDAAVLGGIGLSGLEKDDPCTLLPLGFPWTGTSTSGAVGLLNQP